MGREEEIVYAREHGIPVKGGTEIAPYSIDDNLWGRSSEGRWIEDLDHAPDEDVFQLVTPPRLAPDEAQRIELEFERGLPVALDGGAARWLRAESGASARSARHGVGIIDHIEDRIVGLKVRDIYEAPAAAIILPAPPPPARARSIRTSSRPDSIASGPLPRLRRPLVGAAARGGRLFTWGRSTPAGHRHGRRPALRGKRLLGHLRASPNALYDRSLASFAESGGLFSQTASPGFIELWSLQSRMAWRHAQPFEGSSLGRCPARQSALR